MRACGVQCLFATSRADILLEVNEIVVSPAGDVMMTSRERVLGALARRPIDRTPRLLYEEAIGYTPPIEKLLRERCAPRTPLDYFGMDITRVTAGPSKLEMERFAEWLGLSAPKALGSGQVDECGVWRRAGGFHHFAHVESPLRGIQEFARLKQYPWPDLDQAYRFAGVRERVAELHARGLAVATFAPPQKTALSADSTPPTAASDPVGKRGCGGGVPARSPP